MIPVYESVKVTKDNRVNARPISEERGTKYGKLMQDSTFAMVYQAVDLLEGMQSGRYKRVEHGGNLVMIEYAG